MESTAPAKYLAFRFDVDTHDCLAVGVPRLLELANRLNCRFTFYVNTGKSVHLGHQIGAKFGGKTNSETDVHMLSARHKLGLKEYFRTAILNPNISKFAADQLKALAESEHEVGLHGGRNHEDWVRSAAESWTPEKIDSEIEYGLENLNRFGIKPKGFASPGWVTPPNLGERLQNFGFTYFADRHGDKAEPMFQSDGSNMLNLGTPMSGEPGGVAWIEHKRAQGFSNEQIHEAFRKELSSPGKIKVIYDHPYFAGKHEIRIMEELVNIARDEGFEIVTVEQIVNMHKEAG